MKLRVAVIVGIVLAAAVFRLMPHPPNVTPIAAMALFAGAQFADRRLAWLVPFAALLLSDLALGLHSTMPFVYIAFALTVAMGLWLRNHVRPGAVLGASLMSSTLFYLITNFGAWLSHDMYPRSLDGLMAAYAAGVPFFRNGLFGDLFFVALFFGGFYLAQRRLPQLRQA